MGLCIIHAYICIHGYYPLVKRRQGKWWSRTGWPLPIYYSFRMQRTNNNSKSHLKIFPVFLVSMHRHSYILASPTHCWRIAHISILGERILMCLCYNVCVHIKTCLCMYLIYLCMIYNLQSQRPFYFLGEI
jgi:hypothetical protein